MSTISGVGSASNGAWADASAMRAKMFAKVDKDGSGSVDKTEMQGMLDHIASKTGTEAGNADELLTRMDSDGDGSLNTDELEAGMKSLMPAPKSTVEFANQRGGAARPEGPPPGPPPVEAESTSSSSADIDPLDTNEDGVVSPQEQAAGELKEMMKTLLKAADSDGDQQLSKTELNDMQSRIETVLKQVLQAYADGSESSEAATAVSVAA